MSEITVYSKPLCPQCKAVKHWLTEHELEFTDIDFTKSPELTKKLRDHGFSHAPAVAVDGKIAFTGFNPPELNKLLATVK